MYRVGWVQPNYTGLWTVGEMVFVIRCGVGERMDAMNTKTEEVDIVLIGAGIMSATLGAMLAQIEPNLSVRLFERLDWAATESSDAWNNAGTGHAAFCELNYTPMTADGGVDVFKAIRICEQFEVSKQFWSFLVRQGVLTEPSSFIRAIPHCSFVWGADNVAFLAERVRALQSSPLFRALEHTTDPQKVASWAPLVMEGRDESQPVAATRMSLGTDVNFGHLTRTLVTALDKNPSCDVLFHHEVEDFEQTTDGRWLVWVRDTQSGVRARVMAKFVFIGAGGGTLSLLERAGIPEAKGYGGFPVSGQWLRCRNPDVIAHHYGKVYGMAELGAPPMSVPHLDTRFIDGKRELLFGPYAGFTTKFLKQGSVTDLFESIGFDNVMPMVQAGLGNIDLTRYLVGQALLPHGARMDMLRKYYPQARDEDWVQEIAGLRVQIIKGDGRGQGVLKFGTEVVTQNEGSMAGLLGASPGASTAVSIMLDVLSTCFPTQFKSEAWQRRLQLMIPSLGYSLHMDAALCASVRAETAKALNLKYI